MGLYHQFEKTIFHKYIFFFKKILTKSQKCYLSNEVIFTYFSIPYYSIPLAVKSCR